MSPHPSGWSVQAHDTPIAHAGGRAASLQRRITSKLAKTEQWHSRMHKRTVTVNDKMQKGYRHARSEPVGRNCDPYDSRKT
jgi:hypothetical protein